MNDSTLVIGIGNELRGDDAVGLFAARRVAECRPDVQVRTVQLLTADLALGLGAFKTVIFVDADVQVPEARVSLVVPSFDGLLHDPHQMTPSQLLSVASALDEPLPQIAYQVGLPARSFDHGARLSPAAQAGVVRGVELVARLIDPVPVAV
jgi:hydrogenase maturation protease